MGVDFYQCVVCKNSASDAGYYTYCSNCGGFLCGYDCMYEMAEKYGKAKGKKAKDFGDDSPKECDDCSKATLDSRIATKKKELEELEGQKNADHPSSEGESGGKV